MSKTFRQSSTKLEIGQRILKNPQESSRIFKNLWKNLWKWDKSHQKTKRIWKSLKKKKLQSTRKTSKIHWESSKINRKSSEIPIQSSNGLNPTRRSWSKAEESIRNQISPASSSGCNPLEKHPQRHSIESGQTKQQNPSKTNQPKWNDRIRPHENGITGINPTIKTVIQFRIGSHPVQLETPFSLSLNDDELFIIISSELITSHETIHFEWMNWNWLRNYRNRPMKIVRYKIWFDSSRDENDWILWIEQSNADREPRLGEKSVKKSINRQRFKVNAATKWL